MWYKVNPLPISLIISHAQDTPTLEDLTLIIRDCQDCGATVKLLRVSISKSSSSFTKIGGLIYLVNLNCRCSTGLLKSDVEFVVLESPKLSSHYWVVVLIITFAVTAISHLRCEFR